MNTNPDAARSTPTLVVRQTADNSFPDPSIAADQRIERHEPLAWDLF